MCQIDFLQVLSTVLRGHQHNTQPPNVTVLEIPMSETFAVKLMPGEEYMRHHQIARCHQYTENHNWESNSVICNGKNYIAETVVWDYHKVSTGLLEELHK